MADRSGLCSSLFILFLSLSEVWSFTDGDLRLNGVGASPLVGRLEVYYQGQWGSVCGGSADAIPSLNFNSGAAHVACRQMGLGFAVNFYSLHNLPQYRLQYGVSNGSIFLRDVNCLDDASQNHLLQCLGFFDLGPLPALGCDHTMDVVLQCSNVTSPYNGEIRLVPDPSTPQNDRTPSSGKLELYSKELWKNVCLVGMSMTTANRLCRQMGYTEADRIETTGQVLEGVWHTDENPITCSSTDVCIGSCLPQLPISVATTPCQAVTLSCKFVTSNTDKVFGKQETCERPYRRTPDKSVRLASSSNPMVGRLEVYVGGVWGTVCQDSFSIQDAEVVCKQLGFPYALAEDRVATQTYFSNIPAGNNSTPIRSVPHCRGVEEDLSECSIRNNHNCSASDHAMDVAIKCSWLAPYGSLALHGRVNGSSGASGTLVMYASIDLSPNFYPICDAGFEPQQATVACRQLGYSDGIVLHNSYFGSYGSSADDVLRLTGSCTGSESQLLECTPAAGWDEAAERRGFVPVPANQSSECRPGQDEVALHCVSEEIQFRLIGGESRDRGHLEINYGGTWGRICGSGFGISEALVACRHIGYPSVVSVRVEANAASSSSGPVHLSNLSCSGFERSMLHCHFSLETLASSCSASEDTIWLMCGSEPHPDEGELRLVGEEQRNGTGRVEISFNGEWHSLCGQAFSELAAQVACRELGFSNVTSYCTDACFGRGSNEVLLVKEMCRGSEQSLKDCPRQEYHSTSCDHSFDIGLSCAGPIPEPTSTGPPLPPSTSGLQPHPPQNALNLYYVIGGASGFVVVVVAAAVICLCCCVCVCRRRKQKDAEGRWVNTRRSDITQNGHSHLNVVGDMSKMAPIKEEGFDDPKEMLDEIDISPHPFASYDRSISPPLPLRHHDVILHALSSSSQNSDEDQPSISTGQHHPQQHTHHHAQHHAHLNQATTEFQHVECSKLGGDDISVVVVGTEQRQSMLGNTNHGGSPVSFTSCPPPNYDEIFKSSLAIPETSGYANANRSTGWYDSSVDSDSEDDCKKR